MRLLMCSKVAWLLRGQERKLETKYLSKLEGDDIEQKVTANDHVNREGVLMVQSGGIDKIFSWKSKF